MEKGFFYFHLTARKKQFPSWCFWEGNTFNKSLIWSVTSNIYISDNTVFAMMHAFQLLRSWKACHWIKDLQEIFLDKIWSKSTLNQLANENYWNYWESNMVTKLPLNLHVQQLLLFCHFSAILFSHFPCISVMKKAFLERQ